MDGPKLDVAMHRLPTVFVFQKRYSLQTALAEDDAAEEDLLAMDLEGTSDPYCKFRSVIIHILLQL